jgi:hypothetical protein
MNSGSQLDMIGLHICDGGIAGFGASRIASRPRLGLITPNDHVDIKRINLDAAAAPSLLGIKFGSKIPRKIA